MPQAIQPLWLAGAVGEGRRLAHSIKAAAVVVAAGVIAAAVALGVNHSGTRATAKPVAAARSAAAAIQTPSVSAPSSPDTASTSPASASPTTRAPSKTTAVSAASTAALAAGLDAALAGTNSCLVVSDGTAPDGTAPIYAHQSSAPLIPASTQKLLVAAAALKVLGPNFRFVTQILAPAEPVAGRVDALWLRGGGDPMLASPEYIAYEATRARVSGYPWTSLDAVANAVVGSGITTVAGGIRGDDSRYDQLRYLPAWPASYRQDQEIGALTALPLNEGVQTWKPIATLSTDPPSFAASELARLLTAKSVAIGPSGADQAAPAGSVVVAEVNSAPLSQIVEAMLRASDNLAAELLVRELDRNFGNTGTTAGGVAIVLQQAAAAGLATTGAVMQDGSGLSRGDLATCSELLGALDLSDQPGFGSIATGLAVAGRSGTLAARYVNSPIAGKLQAKTGSLANAGGMVGILDMSRPLHFAFLINQPLNDSQLLAKEDAVVAALATYPTAG